MSEHAERKCNVCKELMPMGAFYRSSTGRDGRGYRCKACSKIRQRKMRAENKERTTSYTQKSKQAHPQKALARHLAKNAQRRGELVPGPCELNGLSECSGRMEKHHMDYNEPLDVTWLCSKHHAFIHSTLRAIAAADAGLL